MKITIENTTKRVTLNGLPARIWEGTTESGIPVHCFISRIGIAKDADATQFEKELEATRAPSPDIESYPARMVL
jgi:hypothetical protein